MSLGSRCHHKPSRDEDIALASAENDGARFLVFRDRGCEGTEGDRCSQNLFLLPEECDRVTIGRTAITHISLDFDPDVSRAHCTLERIGDDWAVVDDGLSRNGSFVNDLRVLGARTLRNGDRLRVGKTTLVYHAPSDARAPTGVAGEPPDNVTAAERRVLIELCTPFRDHSPYATAPTNQEIAEALVVTVETVKAHMRSLFEKFEIEELPHNRKRVRLAERAIETRAISPYELRNP